MMPFHPAQGWIARPTSNSIDAASDPEGFGFLGYTLRKVRRFPQKTRLKKFRDEVRILTKRPNEHALEDIVKDVRGRCEFFKHSLNSAPDQEDKRPREAKHPTETHRPRGARTGR